MSDYVTKNDLKLALKVAVDDAVSQMAEVFKDGTQMVAERFDQVDARFDRIEERMDRMEDKLDRTAAHVDLHSVDIRQLKRKTA